MTRMNREWTVGFDVTSLLVLGHLGLLHKAIGAFQRVVLAPETRLLLMNERRSVRFHQPSLVGKAEEVRALIDQRYLKIEQSLPNPPEWLVNEVGHDLAEILEAARVAGGRVVHPFPIRQLRTFGEIQAELRDYAAFVLSTRAFTNLLSAGGFVDGRAYEHACQFLRAQDHDSNLEVDLSLISHPLYLDDLAVTYLQEAGVLQAACHSGLNLLVHPSTREYQSALIEEKREGHKLAQTLDDIRVTLREALETGQAIFMPRHHWPEEETPIGWFHQVAPTLAQILRDTTPCDIVCVDDRFFNRHVTLTDEAGHTVPIVCVLDLLQHLEAQGVLSTDEKNGALHNLRQAGYVFVPVAPDELGKYLRNATLDREGQVVESAEMRILRQTIMRSRSLDMIELPTEARFLEKMQLGCIIVIRQLWADEGLSVERVVVFSDWVWRHVAPSPLDWMRNIREPLRPGDMPEAFARHLAWLLQPMPLNPERYEVFRDWVERELLGPLLPANADLVDRLVRIVRANIERLSEEFSHG
jgi:hypothetical protein